MRRIFVVRHGNTFEAGEAPRRIGVRSDLPLTEDGEAQGRAIGRHLRAAGIRFDLCLTSPLRRTRSTAQIILGELADPPAARHADWLAEIDHGPDEGLTEDAVIDRIGADALSRWETEGLTPPGWSIDPEGRIAAWRAFFAAQRRLPSGNSLIVTSNGAARFGLLAEDQLSRAAAGLPSLKLRTGAWGEIRIGSHGIARLVVWNSRAR